MIKVGQLTIGLKTQRKGDEILAYVKIHENPPVIVPATPLLTAMETMAIAAGVLKDGRARVALTEDFPTGYLRSVYPAKAEILERIIDGENSDHHERSDLFSKVGRYSHYYIDGLIIFIGYEDHGYGISIVDVRAGIAALMSLNDTVNMLLKLRENSARMVAELVVQSTVAALVKELLEEK